ncbi:9420_t:CDS:2 [Entrophospora sp. SA101]|nr:9420_t:CDS:2 [Entrophospora sp. SA101]
MLKFINSVQPVINRVCLNPKTSQTQFRYFTSSTVTNSVKVAVLGAAGGIGQPLSLLLKHNELITNLSLYDIVNTPGVAADLSHINTASKVSGFLPENDGLKHAVSGSNIIVIPAGVPRKPNMTRDDLFNTNASIVQDLATAAAKYAPEAHLAIISNPVNSTVPIVSEIFKAYEIKGTDPKNERVTVVGGHSGVTIIPLISQTGSNLTEEETKALTHRIQFGGDEVVKAKAGTGSATLSMAYAAAHFTDSLLRAIVKGEKGIIEAAYVKSDLFSEQGIDYFASDIELSPEGVGKIYPLGEVSPYEKELLSAAIPELKKNIDKGHW